MDELTSSAPDEELPTEEQDETALPEGEESAADGEDETAEGAESGAEATEEPAGLVVSFGDEPEADEDEPPADLSPKAASAWVKLRQDARAFKQQARELQRKLEQAQTAPPVAPIVDAGPMPNAVEYETWNEEGAAKLAADMQAWVERKAKADETKRKQEDQLRAQQEDWNRKLAAYATKKAAVSLQARDYDAAESAVRAELTETQQGIILHAAKDPALIVYALGKSPGRVRALAAIQDPVQFAVELGRMEQAMKVTPKKAPPAPAPIVRGGAAGATGGGNLAKLLEKARETGDYTAYHAAKRAKQAA